MPIAAERELLAKILGTLEILLNIKDKATTATMHDDLIVWFRNLFFLEDKRFDQVLTPYKNDVIFLARTWRLHNLCWAVSQACHLEGDLVDVGCYEAKSTHVFSSYNRDKLMSKKIYLFDYFDAPDGDHKKKLHGPNLEAAVKRRMKDFNVDVIAGSVMNSIPWSLPSQICFAHIDLNSPSAEAHVMPEIYNRLSKGGIIIFDDYGFSQWRESAVVHQEFLRDKTERILELPSGQGLLIKL